MIFIWKPHWRGERVDMDRCRASVHDGGISVGMHQCTRKPVVTVDGIGYCKQHSPNEQERRDKERRKKIDDEMAASERRRNREYARIRVFELVKELRDGGWVLSEELIAKLDAAIRKVEP